MTDAEWRLRRTRRQIEERYWEEFENVRTQFPELSDTKLDLRTFESLHQPASVYLRLLTFEANSTLTLVASRRFEANPAPASRQTDEPNSASPQPPTPRTRKQDIPRSAPSPCGSGQKYQRCCGRNAPPVLFPGAQAA
jgi:hypothetical protein